MEQGPEQEIIAPAKFGAATRKLRSWRRRPDCGMADVVPSGGPQRLDVAAFDLLAQVLNRFPDMLETRIDSKRVSVGF